MTTIDDQATAVAGIQFDLPAGWHLREDDDAVCEQAGLAVAFECRASDGEVLVLGAVARQQALSRTAEDLFEELDAAGEAVALGEISGVAAVSLVRRMRAAELDALSVTYLMPCDCGTAVFTFVSAGNQDPNVLLKLIVQVMASVRPYQSDEP